MHQKKLKISSWLDRSSLTHYSNRVCPSVGPSVIRVFLTQQIQENGQKWFSTTLQAFSFNVSLSISVLISLLRFFFCNLPFTIFISLSFLHNLCFITLLLWDFWVFLKVEYGNLAYSRRIFAIFPQKIFPFHS